jgi:hypothetical protein
MKHISKGLALTLTAAFLVSCGGKNTDSLLQDTTIQTCEDDDSLYDVLDKVYFCDVKSKSYAVSKNCLDDLFSMYQKLSVGCRKDVQADVLATAEKVVTSFNDSLATEEFKTLKLDAVAQGAQTFAIWTSAFKLVGQWYDTFGKQVYADYRSRTGTDENSFQGTYNRIFYSLQNSLQSNGDLKFNPGDLHAYFKVYTFALQAASVAFDEASIDGREIYMDLINLILSEIDTRLQIQTYFYDMACWLNVCNKSNTEDQTRALVSLLALLDKPEDMKKQLQNTTAIDRNLRKIFEVVSTHHDRLIQILKTESTPSASLPGLGDSYERVLATRPFDAPQHLTSFASIVQTYKRLDQNFRNFGYYQFNAVNELRNGLDTQARTATLNRLQEKLGNLKTESAALKSDYAANMNLLRDKIQQEITQQKLDTSRNILNLQLDENTRSLMNIRESARQDAEAFNASFKNSQALLDSSFFDAEAVADAKDFPVNQTHIKYDPQNPSLDASFKTISLKKGQILSLTFSNTYAPTCAVSKSEFKSVVDKGFSIRADGFLINKSQGSSKVSSVENYRTSAQYTDMNISASVGPSTTFASVKASQTIGFRTETGVKESDSSSNSTSETFTTFNGLRLRSTPFPQMPAGAIVAMIKTKAADGKTITRKTFVGTGTTLIADSDMEVKLYVNDCKDQPIAIDSSLSGNLVIKQSLAGAGASVLNAIASGVRLLEEKRDSILDLGPAATVELDVLKKTILTNALSASSEQVQEFSKIRSLTELFTLLIDQKVAMLQKEILARDLERQIKRDNLQLDELIASTNLISAQNRVIDNLYKRSLLNQDVTFAGMYAKDTLDYFFSNVRPFVDIYYPNAKRKIQASALDTNKLRKYVMNLSDFNQPLDGKIESLSKVIDEINEKLKDDTIIVDNNTERTYIAVALPKVAPTRRPIYSTITDYRNSDIFKAIESSADSASLAISYSDLYRDSSANFGLSTLQTRPIIRRAILGLGMAKNPVLEPAFLESLSGGWNVTFNVGDFIKIPTASSSTVFSFNKEEYSSLLSKQIPIAFVSVGDLNKLKTHLTNAESIAGKGFSPFSTISLTATQTLFSYLNEDNADLEMPLLPFVQELYIMFEVEFQTDSKMNWLSAELKQ